MIIDNLIPYIMMALLMGLGTYIIFVFWKEKNTFSRILKGGPRRSNYFWPYVGLIITAILLLAAFYELFLYSLEMSKAEY